MMPKRSDARIMFAQWPSWLSKSPSVRRAAIKLWRVLLRVQRAQLQTRSWWCAGTMGTFSPWPYHQENCGLPTSNSMQVEEWLGQLI